MSNSEDSEAEEFTESLVYIGCNRVTAEVIVKQGFTSPIMLLTVTEDSLSEMTRQVTRSNPPNGVTFSFVSVNLLKGYRHWAASHSKRAFAIIALSPYILVQVGRLIPSRFFLVRRSKICILNVARQMFHIVESGQEDEESHSIPANH
jgi:hypothetical protein